MIDTDINECERDISLCRSGQCINNDGSFQCICEDGQELTENGTACRGNWSHIYLDSL